MQVNGNTADGFEKEFSPTQITFKARSDQEAMKKANKFWRESEMGAGSITVVQENSESNPTQIK